MSDFRVRFVPVYGGYAVHTSGCRHKVPDSPRHLYGAPRLLEHEGDTLTAAVAALYRSSPVGILTPDRFEVRDCARHIPLTRGPGYWDTHHDAMVGRAAHFLWVCSSGSTDNATSKVNEVLEDVHELEHSWQWRPDPGMLREQTAATYAARLWQTVRADDEEPQETDTETCRRFVLRAEAALRDAVERLVLEEGQSPEPMEQGLADAERAGAWQFAQAVRSCLAHVHAHRALRDGCARPVR